MLLHESNSIDIDKFNHFSFDLWLTILKSHPEYKYQRCLLLKDFFSISDVPETISEVIRYYDVLCNKISEKTGDHIPMEHIILLILEKLNVNTKDIDTKIIEEFYEETEKLLMTYKPILLHNDIANLFYSIKMKGKTINISSNTAFIRGKSLRKVLDFYNFNQYFSFQLYSDELGYSKPNSLFFEKVFNEAKKIHTDIEKTQIVHIGDNPIADYKGATEYGIQSILI